MAGLECAEARRNWHVEQEPGYFASTVKQQEHRLNTTRSGSVTTQSPELDE